MQVYHQAHAQDFPQGGGAQFFLPPPEKISPTLRGGGKIFPEGGENPEESYKIKFLRQILLKYWSSWTSHPPEQVQRWVTPRRVHRIFPRGGGENYK